MLLQRQLCRLRQESQGRLRWTRPSGPARRPPAVAVQRSTARPLGGSIWTHRITYLFRHCCGGKVPASPTKNRPASTAGRSPCPRQRPRVGFRSDDRLRLE